MKGKIILIPLKEPKEGMKVVVTDTLSEGILSRFQDSKWIVHFAPEDSVDFTERYLVSELQQIAVEYWDENQGYPIIKVPLHPDDYEKALPLIGKEVEFKEACLIGCEAIRDHAKLITPTPVMYTEEEVLKLIENYDLFFWNNIQVATLHNDNYKPHIWWNENKKK